VTGLPTTRRARPDETTLVADVLAAAFVDDPVVRWIFRDDDAGRWFRVSARHEHCSPDAADLRFDGGRAVGAALWDPPSFRAPLVHRVLLIPMILTTMRPSAAGRGAAASKLMQQHRPKQSHWYLAQLGAIEPGRGHGSALLAHRLAAIDGPAYLESSNIRNVPLYERYGFVVTGEITLPDSGPTLYAMWRDG
jgi:GNAT superfamily N-acetyltransferase